MLHCGLLLKRAEDLESLFLIDTNVTNANLDADRALNHLSTLDISRTNVNGQLTAVPESVRRLMVRQTRLEKLNLVPGATRAALEDLRLDQTPVTDTMLNDVAKCPNLGILWLDWTHLPTVDWPWWVGCTNLFGFSWMALTSPTPDWRPLAA